MDVEIKTKEVDISIDNHPKLVKIGDQRMHEYQYKIMVVYFND